MNYGTLQGELRELIGFSVFDRFFNSEQWVADAFVFACDQCASLLGLTYIDGEQLLVQTKRVGIPEDAISILSVTEMAMGKPLLKSSLLVEDRANPRWRSRVGEPTFYLEISGREIVLNGQPASNYVLVGYIQRPAIMALPDDAPDIRIPEVMHPHLKYAAAAYLLQLAGQGQDIARGNELLEQFLYLIGVGPAPLAKAPVDR